MSLCIGPVCIPYSVLWPILALIIKRALEFFRSLGGKTETNGKNSCVNGTCALPNSQNDSSVIASGSVACDTPTEQNCVFEMKANMGCFYLEDSMNWKREIMSTQKVVIARFTAKWCKPCHLTAQIFETLSHDECLKKRGIFVLIDVDTHDHIAAEYFATTIPLIVAIKNGNEIGRYSGKDEDNIKKFVEKCLL